MCGPTASAEQILNPIERELARFSIGPTVGLSGTVSRPNGVGLLPSLGLALGHYTLNVETDPACEERRREEREALGGERVKPWGEVLEHAQQPCRPLAQWWSPDFEAGAEFLLGGRGNNLRVRGWTGLVGWRRLLLGVSTTLLQHDPGADQPVRWGLWLGPELAAHFRFEVGRFRPVVVGFIRAEISAVARDFFPDQGVLGVRCLWGI